MGHDKQQLTVDEAIDFLGFGRFQSLILLYAGMSWMAEAMEMMLLSFVGPAVRGLWDLSPRQESAISSIVFAGMMVGAFTWGILSDSRGRRTGFLATAVITFIAGFLSAFSPSYYALLILRSLVGVGLGGGPVVSSWFMEFVPSTNRGFWMIIFSVFWTVGSVVEALLAWIVMPRLGWRWLLGFSSMPLLVLLVFYPIVPESPRYYAAKGETEKSLKILKMIAAMNKRELPAGNFLATRGSELDEVCLLQEAEVANISHKSKKRSWWNFHIFSELLSPPLLKSTILVWLIFFANAFTYYGLVLLSSQLSSQGVEGCFREQTVPKQPGASVFRDVLLTSLAELPGLGLAAAIVDYYGRKTSMASLFFACGVFLAPLLHDQSEGITTICMFGARACIMGTFTILYIYAPEMYPTSLRTTGLGTANSFARVGGMVCPLVAVALMRSCHRFIAVALFAIVSMIATVLIVALPIETKGRALSDAVQQED